MRDNKLVLGYIGNGKSANRYHIPFVQTRKVLSFAFFSTREGVQKLK